MLWSRLGTIGLSAIQGSLEADAVLDHAAIRVSNKTESAIVQFEPQAPITASDIRNGIVRISRRPLAERGGDSSHAEKQSS